MLRYFNLWASIGWLMVVVICYLSLVPSLPSMGFTNSDKLGHFISYFILMFWFSQLFKTSLLRAGYAVFFIILGIGLEIMQALGGVRYFEYADMFANSCGVLFAWLISRGKLQNLLLTFEQMLIK